MNTRKVVKLSVLTSEDNLRYATRLKMTPSPFSDATDAVPSIATVGTAVKQLVLLSRTALVKQIFAIFLGVEALNDVSSVGAVLNIGPGVIDNDAPRLAVVIELLSRIQQGHRRCRLRL